MTVAGEDIASIIPASSHVPWAVDAFWDYCSTLMLYWLFTDALLMLYWCSHLLPPSPRFPRCNKQQIPYGPYPPHAKSTLFAYDSQFLQAQMLAGLVSRTTDCSHFECSCHGVTTQGCCNLTRLAHALEKPLLYLYIYVFTYIHVYIYCTYTYIHTYIDLYIYIYRERERRNRISQACAEQTYVEDPYNP